MTDEQLSKIFREYSFRENAKGEFDMDLSGFKHAIAEYEAEKAKETCKWTVDKDVSTSSCRNLRYYNAVGYNYCPCCGKRIEVVE